MNDAVLRLYNDYLEKTSDKAAAASLTLADVMQSSLDARGEPAVLPAAETPLTIKDAAARFGVAVGKVHQLTARGSCAITGSASQSASCRQPWRITNSGPWRSLRPASATCATCEPSESRQPGCRSPSPWPHSCVGHHQHAGLRGIAFLDDGHSYSGFSASLIEQTRRLSCIRESNPLR